jgi:NAD(P)-dependent dehydrogenase (short-subunit alcohol dehydrogenase family)
MSKFPYSSALIVGTGPGISVSVARRLTGLGVKVAVAARDIGKLKSLVDKIGAAPFAVDAPDASALASLFEQVEEKQGAPDLVVFDASGRARGPLAEVDSATAEKAIAISAFGGLLVTQHRPHDA